MKGWNRRETAGSPYSDGRRAGERGEALFIATRTRSTIA